MDINNLQAFIKVAENASFSAAAAQLHLTQPAISKRIATLESTLGARLFDRIGRSVHLTEAGQHLLPRAYHLLDEVRDIRRDLDTLRDEIGGTLSFGTSHHIGLHRLPPVLAHYSRHYPKVQLDIRFMDSERICNAVEQGQLELGIVTLPIAPPQGIELLPIWEDTLYFVVGTSHPLANRSDCTLELLTRFPAVLPGTGTYTRGILEQALQPLGLHVRTGLSTNYLETLKMLATVGLGWSLLPGTLVTGSDLKVLNIEEIHLTRSLGVVRHRNRTLSNAAITMLNTCRDH